MSASGKEKTLFSFFKPKDNSHAKSANPAVTETHSITNLLVSGPTTALSTDLHSCALPNANARSVDTPCIAAWVTSKAAPSLVRQLACHQPSFTADSIPADTPDPISSINQSNSDSLAGGSAIVERSVHPQEGTVAADSASHPVASNSGMIFKAF